MGKVHRIKRQLERILAQRPVPLGYHHIKDLGYFRVHKNNYGEYFYSCSESYRKLVEKICRPYFGRGAW